jgi:hypothetical protein
VTPTGGAYGYGSITELPNEEKTGAETMILSSNTPLLIPNPAIDDPVYLNEIKAENAIIESLREVSYANTHPTVPSTPPTIRITTTVSGQTTPALASPLNDFSEAQGWGSADNPR